MATTIWSDLKQQFRGGNMIVKLIMINVAIHLLLSISEVPLYLFFSGGDASYQKSYNDFLHEWLWLPSDMGKLITRPWTLVTYMFLHKDILHLLFNMLLLYWFGRILNDLISNQRVLSIYLMGGLLGGIFFVGGYNLFPAFAQLTMLSYVVGASASMMAVVAATTVLHPHGVMRFILIGAVELQYIAWFIILVDIILIPVNNSGGHIAHLGGAILGWLYIRFLVRGVDIGKPLQRFFAFLNGLFSRNQAPQPKAQPRRENPQTARSTSQTVRQESVQNPIKTTGNTATDNIHSPNIHPYLSGYGASFTKQYQHLSPQECIDAILDKIQRSTYNSLSDDEKSFLEKVGRDKLI